MATWLANITELDRSHVQIRANCLEGTTMKLASSFRFFSRLCSLEPLEQLDFKHHLIPFVSSESWPGVLQMNQKHIKGWKIRGRDGFPVSDGYSLQVNAKSLVGPRNFLRKCLSSTQDSGGGCKSENPD